MNCANCHFEFSAPRDASTEGTGLDAHSPNTAGAIFLCGACGAVNISDSGGLRLILEKEAQELDNSTRKELWFAIRQVLAANRKANIKIHNPVEEMLKNLERRA